MEHNKIKMEKETVRLHFECDATPALSFLQLLNVALKGVHRPVDLPDFPKEPICIKQHPTPACAGKVSITLYPSDALFRFASAFLADNFDLGAIEDPCHD
jgi:hypothetical protein